MYPKPANLNWTNTFFVMQEKTKNTQLLQNKFNVLEYSIDFLLPVTSRQTWFELSTVKLYRKNDPRGNEKCFQLAGGSGVIEGSSYRG